MRAIDHLLGIDWVDRLVRDEGGRLRLPVDNVDEAVFDALSAARRRSEQQHLAATGDADDDLVRGAYVAGLYEFDAMAFELEELGDLCFAAGLILLSEATRSVPAGPPSERAYRVASFLRSQLMYLDGARDLRADARSALDLVEAIALAMTSVLVEVRRRQLDHDIGPPHEHAVTPIRRNAPPTPQRGAVRSPCASWRVMAAA